MELKQQFHQYKPNGFYVEKADSRGIGRYLESQGLKLPDEQIKNIEVPGSGNMNLVLRITTDRQSFIIKQARPWVEKYPAISAPYNRSQLEAAFYHQIEGHASLQKSMPRLIHQDRDSEILIFEDLGNTSDFTNLYKGGVLTEHQLNTLVEYLAHLHQADTADRIENRDMRLLNHEHIFIIPFVKDNGLDLDLYTPGLNTLAQTVIDTELQKKPWY